MTEEEFLKQGGKEKGHERQKRLGRLWVRKRLELLLDPDAYQLELGLYQGWNLYKDPLPAAGVITVIGQVEGRAVMVIANDATVKAGALYPQSVKKILRAQRIAFQWALPLIYLVDSAGVYLPMQDEIFPDEDDFGRIFRNNSVLAAKKHPQFAAILGDCIAGGGYLPVLCDQVLMTRGSGLYLAGPQLVEAAIGQRVEREELGGADMHASLSGTVDYVADTDEECLSYLRDLVRLVPESYGPLEPLHESRPSWQEEEAKDVRDVLKNILDPEWMEYKKEFGKTLCCLFATLGGRKVGVVANQRKQTTNGEGEVQMGGVIYQDSAQKAAHFVRECSALEVPLLFFQDVVGFMVGKKAEQEGIIQAGAKLVHAVSTASVPKMTCIMGNSFGAGHYALCGKAYDPDLIVAWPGAKYAVMGAKQAEKTLQDPSLAHLFDEQMDIRHAASKGFIDAIIAKETTRELLLHCLPLALRKKRTLSFSTGIER